MNLSQAPNIITRRSFLRRTGYTGLGAAACASTIRDLCLVDSAMAANLSPDPNEYKALVCVFLAGGNDANNWMVPTDSETFAQYQAIRGNLAFQQSDLLPFQQSVGGPAYTDADGHPLGFHPGCAGLQTLFAEKKLATVFNVGTLLRPITRAEYLTNATGSRPPQLFSHSDQVTQWQTSIPDQPPATGWGGRSADILDILANKPDGKISMSVSVSGANTLETGNLVPQYQVSTTGAVTLSGSLMTGTGTRVRALRDILALSHPNLQRTAYSDVVENAIATGELLNSSIGVTMDPTDGPVGGYTNALQVTGFNAGQTWKWNTGLTGIYNPALAGFGDGLGGFPNTSLGQQLKMIARLIAAHGPSAFKMRRQVFFCQNGGHDTHTNQVTVNNASVPADPAGTHYVLMKTASDAIFAFQRAMEQLGLGDKVTTFTASDFSRTFPTNSQGSDHGWGSHHIVVGGAVNGGAAYGHMPTFAINGPDDTGTGRWIPTTSVDQHSSTLARWFGLENSEIAAVFPNVHRFATDNLGFMKPA